MARARPKPADNPFLPSLIARGAHFADREAEVERIRSAYQTPGARLVVYGDRRMGKTSALHRAADAARKDKTPVAYATFATASDPSDAAASLLLAVREQVGRNWRTTLESMVGRLQGSFNVKPASAPGLPPSVSITFGLREEELRADLVTAALDAIDAQMNAEDRRLAIAIDEFQRLHEWGGENAEWALKAALESHTRLSYVLAGSKRHVIEAMITTKGRALWKQVDAIEFGPIDPEELASWIQSQAARTGVTISLAAADEIVRLSGPRTRDVVQLAREVWFEGRTREFVEPDHVAQAMDQWVEVQKAIYAALWRARTVVEQKILRSLAAEPSLALTSAAALSRYRLGPKSTVQITAVRLVEDELLVALPGGGYTFDDPFFRRWIELEVLQHLGLTPA